MGFVIERDAATWIAQQGGWVSKVHIFKSKGKISQTFVAFSEYLYELYHVLWFMLYCSTFNIFGTPSHAQYMCVGGVTMGYETF